MVVVGLQAKAVEVAETTVIGDVDHRRGFSSRPAGYGSVGYEAVAMRL